MATQAQSLDSRQSQLDALLEEVCLALQLTQTQYEDAKAKYEAVGRWLAGDGSALYAFEPNVYPQGSMSLLSPA